VFLSLFVLAACGSKEHTITFNTQTDQTVEPIHALKGNAIFAPEVELVREGYRFDGWTYEGELFQFSLMSGKDIELTAKWSKYYTLSIDPAGGNYVSSITVAEGDEVVITEFPERDHYKLVGWLFNGAEFDTSSMPSSNIVITAVWTPASTITFEAEVYDRFLDEMIEIEIKNIVEVSGADISAPAIPEYIEHKFLSWQLDGEDYTFTTMPSEDITLTATWLELSNLPALSINLYNDNNSVLPLQYVTRETYVKSTISLENTTSDFEITDASALFKGRGNGSWIDSGYKKGYRIKFDDKQSIFGTTASRHWVILAGANFDDVTMFRNKLAFNMASEIFTNIEYATSAEWVDLYVNGEYRGVYVIAEHLRVDEDRVDIESEYNILDTGYLVEYDAYASGVNGVDYFTVDGMRYPFTMKSPDPTEYTEDGVTIDEYKAQVEYIQALVQGMVTAVNNKDLDAFREYADVDSFVDMYILHELFKNIDTGYSSFYIYREPGGKLFAGPPWDFDATLGCSPNRGNASPLGIYVALAVQAFSSRTSNELLINLYNTPEFYQIVEERWEVLSPNIQNYVDDTLTDEMIETYQYAMGRNFVRWPTPQGFGTEVSQETAEANWAENIVILRDWLTDRVTWLDGEWNTD